MLTFNLLVVKHFSDKPRGLRAVREEMRRSFSIEPYSCLSLTMEIKSDRHMILYSITEF